MIQIPKKHKLPRALTQEKTDVEGTQEYSSIEEHPRVLEMPAPGILAVFLDPRVSSSY